LIALYGRTLFGKRAMIDRASERMKRGNGDCGIGVFERVATEQTDPIGRIFDPSEPRAESEGDERILATVRAQERGQARVARRDMCEFSTDEKTQLLWFEMTDPLRGDDQGVRLADTDRDEWHEGIVAHEHLRCRDAERARAVLNECRDVAELAFVHANARTENWRSCTRMLEPRSRPRPSETRSIPPMMSNANSWIANVLPISRATPGTTPATRTMQMASNHHSPGTRNDCGPRTRLVGSTSTIPTCRSLL